MNNTPRRKKTRVFISRGSNGVSKIRRMNYTEKWSEIAKAVKVRDGYCCKVCGRSENLEVHHIIPLSKGGTNSKANLICICAKCHDKRHRDNPVMKNRSSSKSSR